MPERVSKKKTDKAEGPTRRAVKRNGSVAEATPWGVSFARTIGVAARTIKDSVNQVGNLFYGPPEEAVSRQKVKRENLEVRFAELFRELKELMLTCSVDEVELLIENQRFWELLDLLAVVGKCFREAGSAGRPEAPDAEAEPPLSAGPRADDTAAVERASMPEDDAPEDRPPKPGRSEPAVAAEVGGPGQVNLSVPEGGEALEEESDGARGSARLETGVAEEGEEAAAVAGEGEEAPRGEPWEAVLGEEYSEDEQEGEPGPAEAEGEERPEKQPRGGRRKSDR